VKVSDDITYWIEMVLRRVKNKVLVKLWRWVSQFSSWISRTDVQLSGLKV
jgi:hypothetical protein